MPLRSKSSSPKHSSSPEYLLIAAVMRPHGVRGDLSVKMLTKFPERMNERQVIYIGADAENPQALVKYNLSWVRHAKEDQWLFHIKDINTREEADDFRSKYIFISLADAVPLDDDEVYLFQVIGLNVQTDSGEPIGTVTDIIETGANDVYVVQSEKYREVLIPAIKGVILDIDPQNGIMLVHLPDGLLPEPKPSPDEDS
jgi:16S rRNA processing protein RimM